MCCSPNLSIFIGINLSSDHSWIFQLCVVPQIFRHFIAIDLSSNHFLTFKLCVFRQYFHNYCNWLIIQSNVNFQIVSCSPNLSTYIAINLSSNHFWIFERCVIFQSFVNFQIVRCSPNLSTLIAISKHLWILVGPFVHAASGGPRHSHVREVIDLSSLFSPSLQLFPSKQ